MNPSDNIPEFMYYADTVHDMWPVNKTARGEDIRFKLNNIMTPSVEQYLHDKTGGKVTASKIEDSTEKFIEEKYSLPSNSFNLTYSQIMDDYRAGKQGGPLLEKVKNSYGLTDVLVISGIDEKGESLTKNTPERNYIANFILNFFIPDYKSQEAGFVFDASQGKLPYVFYNIKQCETCKTSLTFADSAITSTDDADDNITKKSGNDKFNKSLSKLNRWSVLFPPNKDNQYLYPVTSNLFTKDKLQLMYYSPDNTFNKNNPYSIILKVTNKTNGKSYETSFNYKNKNGASVAELKNIILKKPGNLEKMLNLKQITDELKKPGSKINEGEIEKFLYDYKRSGDYEQVNAMEYIKPNYNLSIFSSIDILCVLYARMKNFNCIRTQAGNIYLYRFPGSLGELTPEVKLKKKLTELNIKCRQLLKIIELIKAANGNPTFQTNYNSQNTFFDETIQYAKQNKTLPIAFINKLLEINIVSIKSKFVEILGSSSLLTFLDNKIKETFTPVSNLLGNNQGIINKLLNNTDQYDALITFLTNFIDAKDEDIISNPQLFNVTNNTINYEMQDTDGSNSKKINIELLTTYFGLEDKNIYEKIINTVDKIYNEEKNTFNLNPTKLVKSNGELIENRNVPFPLFTTKDYSYIYKSIDQINTEFKKRRINNIIIIINVNILLDEINTVITNIENLNPEWVNIKDDILKGFSIVSNNINKEEFDRNLQILKTNIEDFYNKVNESAPGPGEKMGIEDEEDADSDEDEELQKAMAMSMQKDPDDAMDTEGKKDSAPDSDDLSVSSPPRRSPRLTQPKNQFSALFSDSDSDSDSDDDSSVVNSPQEPVRRSKRDVKRIKYPKGGAKRSRENDNNEPDVYTPSFSVTSNPSFYFELNETFNSVTQPLRATIDSIYSINYKGENIYNLLENLKQRMDSINVQITKTTDPMEKTILNENKENAWNRNATPINNLIYNLREDIIVKETEGNPYSDFHMNKRLVLKINEILGAGGYLTTVNTDNTKLDAIFNNFLFTGTSYLEYVKKINDDINDRNNLVDQIHYLYALWITEYNLLLYVNNITVNNVPSSIDLIGFILALKTKQEATGTLSIDIDERYKNIFTIIQTYQNTGKTPEGVRQSDINVYNDIFTYYAYNLNSSGIYPEVITAVIFAYLDYKTNSDILLFKFPPQVNSLLPDNRLLSKIEWDTFYQNIVPFFAAFNNTNISLSVTSNRTTRRRVNPIKGKRPNTLGGTKKHNKKNKKNKKNTKNTKKNIKLKIKNFTKKNNKVELSTRNVKREVLNDEIKPVPLAKRVY